MSEAATLEITGREVQISNPDRILWPQAGYSKKDLIDYYAGVFSAWGLISGIVHWYLPVIQTALQPSHFTKKMLPAICLTGYKPLPG